MENSNQAQSYKDCVYLSENFKPTNVEIGHSLAFTKGSVLGGFPPYTALSSLPACISFEAFDAKIK